MSGTNFWRNFCCFSLTMIILVCSSASLTGQENPELSRFRAQKEFISHANRLVNENNLKIINLEVRNEQADAALQRTRINFTVQGSAPGFAAFLQGLGDQDKTTSEPEITQLNSFETSSANNTRVVHHHFSIILKEKPGTASEKNDGKTRTRWLPKLAVFLGEVSAAAPLIEPYHATPEFSEHKIPLWLTRISFFEGMPARIELCGGACEIPAILELNETILKSQIASSSRVVNISAYQNGDQNWFNYRVETDLSQK